MDESESQQCFERQYQVLPSLYRGGFNDYFDHWVCDNSYLVYSYTFKTLTSLTSRLSEHECLKSELPNETLSYPTADIVRKDLEVISGGKALLCHFPQTVLGKKQSPAYTVTQTFK